MKYTSPHLSDLPPQNLEAERAVVGALLHPNLDAAIIPTIRELLPVEAFYSERNALIYQTIMDLHSRGELADLITVTAALGTKARNGDGISAVYISTLIDATPTSAGIVAHAKLIAKAAHDRAEQKIYRQVADGEMDRTTAKGMLDRLAADAERGPDAGLVRLDTVTPERVSWLWPGYIALGKFADLAGDPGLGKSIVSLDLAARCSRGLPMPDGSPGIQGGVVILALEDGLADTVVPRLLAAGGDPARVVAVQGVPTSTGGLRLPTVQDVQHLRRACEQVDARLIVIDPIMGYLGHETNSYKDSEVRQALGPLVKLAEERGCAVLIIRHLNKGQHSNSLYRGGGSIAFAGLCRMAFLVGRDPDNEQRRILAGVKANLAPMPPSLAYTIESLDGVPHVAWAGTCNHTADGLLAVPTNPEDRSVIDEARDFLRETLAGGSVNAKEVQEQAGRAGLSRAALRRAKKLLGVRSEKLHVAGTWKWSLPQGAHTPLLANDEHVDNVEHLDREKMLNMLKGCKEINRSGESTLAAELPAVPDPGRCARCGRSIGCMLTLPAHVEACGGPFQGAEDVDI